MLCDRVAIVFKGKLRSVGKLDDLVAREAKWIEVIGARRRSRRIFPANGRRRRTARRSCGWMACRP